MLYIEQESLSSTLPFDSLRKFSKSREDSRKILQIIWERGVVETQISNKVKSDLEKQLSYKYHPKSNKQIEEKYLESNYVQQEK